MSDSDSDTYRFSLRQKRGRAPEPEAEEAEDGNVSTGENVDNFSDGDNPDGGATSPDVPEAPEDPLKKRKLITLIRKYKKAFPDKCADIEDTGLQEKSTEELEEIIRDCRFSVSHGSVSELIHMGADVGVRVWEKMCNDIFGLGIYGLPVYLGRDKAWKDLLTEWELLHADFTEVPVEYRIGFTLVKATYTLYALKEAQESVKAAPANTQAVPQELDDKWKGL